MKARGHQIKNKPIKKQIQRKYRIRRSIYFHFNSLWKGPSQNYWSESILSSSSESKFIITARLCEKFPRWKSSLSLVYPYIKILIHQRTPRPRITSQQRHIETSILRQIGIGIGEHTTLCGMRKPTPNIVGCK